MDKVKDKTTGIKRHREEKIQWKKEPDETSMENT